jgi:hypothetical protein
MRRRWHPRRSLDQWRGSQNSIGPVELLRAAKAYGQKLGVDYVILGGTENGHGVVPKRIVIPINRGDAH